MSSQAFTEFVEDLHAHLTRDPNARLQKGIDRDLDRLPDPSLAAAGERLDEARSLLGRADEIEREALAFDQTLDLDLARLMLEAELHRDTCLFNDRPRLAQTPTAGDDIGEGIYLLLVSDPRPAAERLRDIVGRLDGVPAYVDALLARLDTPVARWVDMDLEKVTGLPALLDGVATWARHEGCDAPGLAAARESAERALERYRGGLAAMPTTDRFAIGLEEARRVVALRGIERSVEEIHGFARTFLAETSAEIDELRRRLVDKYGLPASTTTAELHASLNQRYRVELPSGKLEDILVRYERERERILAFIQERDLFPILADQDMKLLRTPGFMAPSIPAGAMLGPPPFRPGVRTSLVYLTLSDELVSEHTELTIPSMMIHEGIPGHHLQLATAAAHPSVVRRHFEAMEHAEGWTTMLEDYMLDVGYMADLADEVRFCGKRDLARIGARVAIDLFFMSGERGFLDVGVPCDISASDPFQAAGALLAEVTGFTPGRVQAELNWYSQERGYPLSYLTGNRLVWELKAELARAQAGKLEGPALDREFHRIYLQSGNMPVAYLRRVFVHEGLLPA